MRPSSFLSSYPADWISFCLLAVAVAIRERAILSRDIGDYIRLLFVQWKVGIFIPAFVFVTFAGRFTDDETWDVVTGGGMAILTFLTAPFAVGLAWKVAYGERPRRLAMVAAALWLFSASWFYDGYLLWRDGAYTHRWWANLIVSSVLYLAAGVLWNLEVTADRRGDFAFLHKDWPKPTGETGIGPIFPAMMVFVVLAAIVLVCSVNWNLWLPGFNGGFIGKPHH